MKIRIQKFLAERGLGSRRQIEEMIKNKNIKVNNKLAELGMKVNENDKIEVRGKLIDGEKEKKIYIMFNKPKGVLSTCKKSKEKGQTVLDYVTVKERIYPIGRLDKDSEGLLLLTNDGDLALKLTHPRYEHEKEYLVKIQDTCLACLDSESSLAESRRARRARNNNQKRFKSQILNFKPLSDDVLDKLRSGVDIGGYITKKSTVRALTKNSFLITLKEGKNRQIRRMCEAVGLKVLELRRMRIGKLELGDLKTGGWRRLRNKEIKK